MLGTSEEAFSPSSGASRGTLNYRFVVLGVLLLVVGGYTFVFPQQVSPPTPVSDRTILTRIAPGNYSAVQVALAPQQTLQVSFTSSPESVDFFLMNSSVFTTWNASGHPPINVYSQSMLDAKNYTFNVADAEGPEGLSLVLVGRSTSTSTNVLLHVVILRESDLVQTLAIPAVITALGVAAVAFGATRTKKVKPGTGDT